MTFLRRTHSGLTLIAAVLIVVVLTASSARAGQGLTLAEEQKMRRQVIAGLRSVMVKDHVLTEHLKRIGRKLYSKTSNMPFEPMFIVIQDRQLNAFATPGGVIAVTSGLLEEMDNVDELASVMGHEMGHVAERHISERVAAAGKISWASIAGVVAGILAGVAAGSGELASAAIMTSMAGGQTAMLAYSRTQEYSADQWGSKVIPEAGYDLTGMYTLTEKIIAHGRMMGGDAPTFLSTHPTGADRIARLKNMRSPTKPDPNRVGLADWDFFKAHLAAITKNKNYFRDKTGPAADYGRGLNAMLDGRLNEAIDLLGRAYNARPHALGAAEVYAEALRQLGQHKEASYILAEAENERPFDRCLVLARGQNLLDLNRVDEAARILGEMVQLEPDDADAIHSLSVARGRQGRLAEAHALLGEAFALAGLRVKSVKNFAIAESHAKTPKEKEFVKKHRNSVDALLKPDKNEQ